MLKLRHSDEQRPDARRQPPADIEGSKSNIAMNAWLPQPTYPEGFETP